MEIGDYEIYQKLHPDKAVFLVRNTDTNEFFVKKIYKYHEGMIYQNLLGKHFDGIPRVISYEQINADQVCVIEEYIKGSNLSDYIQQHGTLSIQESTELIVKLCDILSQLHSLNPPIIHRDIKPSNIIMADNGSVWLIDFNAAKEVHDDKTSDTYYIGTKKYAAPEQYGFGRSDVRTDIYGLGKTLQYLVYVNPSGDVATAIPNKIKRAIDKCTHQLPEKRFANTAALKNYLTSNKKPLWLWTIPCVALLGIVLLCANIGATKTDNAIETVSTTYEIMGNSSEVATTSTTAKTTSTEANSSATAGTTSTESTFSTTLASTMAHITQASTVASTQSTTAATQAPKPALSAKTVSTVTLNNTTEYIHVGIENFGNQISNLGEDIVFTTNGACDVFLRPERTTEYIELQLLPTKNYSGPLEITFYRCGTTAATRDSSDEYKLTINITTKVSDCNHSWKSASCHLPYICQKCNLYMGYNTNEYSDLYEGTNICLICNKSKSPQTTVKSIEILTEGAPDYYYARGNLSFKKQPTTEIYFTVHYEPDSRFKTGSEYGYTRGYFDDDYFYYVSETATSVTYKVKFRYRYNYSAYPCSIQCRY